MSQDRQLLKDALRPFADSHAALVRSGYFEKPNGTALMYDVHDPHFLGPCIHDLAKLAAVFDQMVAEDGGSRL